jgi:hypothetical protein
VAGWEIPKGRQIVGDGRVVWVQHRYLFPFAWLFDSGTKEVPRRKEGQRDGKVGGDGVVVRM